MDIVHDKGIRYEIMTTNMSECFNSVLKNARFLPITALAELTFFRLVSYFEGRRAWGKDALKRSTVYISYVHGLISTHQSKASTHRVTWLDRTTYVFHVKTTMNGPYMSRGDHVQVILWLYIYQLYTYNYHVILMICAGSQAVWTNVIVWKVANLSRSLFIYDGCVCICKT